MGGYIFSAKNNSYVTCGKSWHQTPSLL